MKKIIKLLLAFSLLFTGVVKPAHAEEKKFDDDKLEYVFKLYQDSQQSFRNLELLDSFGYRALADHYKDKKLTKTAIKASSWLIDEHLEEKDIIMILSKIIQYNEMSIYQQVKEQEPDYSKVFLELALDAFSPIVELANGKKIVNIVKETVDKGKDLWEIGTDYQKFVEAFVVSNSNSYQFLDAIINNTTDDNLKNAAKKLKDLQNKLLQSRIEALTNAAEEIIHFEAEIFFKDMGVDILREFDETGTNKELLDVLELGIDTFDEAKAAFDLTMCVGTYMFGTKDTYRGIQEIFYLDEITSCVLAECNKVSVSKNGIKNYNKMLEKCDYYKWLVTISSYGESCNYNMMTSKKNVLAFIRNYFDKKLGNKTPDEWYKEQIKWLNVYNKKLDEIKSINIYEIDETNREESTESENNQEDIKNEIIGTWVGAEDISNLSSVDPIVNNLVFAADGSYSMFIKSQAEYTGTYTIENNKVVLSNNKKHWVQGDSENYKKTITYEYKDGILTSVGHDRSFGFAYYAKVDDNSIDDVIDTNGEMETNYEAMYESVLSMYRRVIANNYYEDSNWEVNEASDIDVNPELLFESRNSDNFAVYYALIDINGNGVPELIIGAGAPDNIRKYDIFILDNGSPRRFLDNDAEAGGRVNVFGYRTNFYLEENGIIAIYGSGSATSGGFDFYKISLDGSTDELINSLWHENEKYYDSQRNSISKKEHDSILSKYTGSTDWNLIDKFDLQWERIE